MAEIILITKSGGPLTKQIKLDESGALKSDGSACVMSRGTAQRQLLASVGDLAALIGSLRSDQAIALGVLRPGLPERVNVATKRAINGHAAIDLIARSADYIGHRAGQPGFALLDFDGKGMAPDIAERIKKAGGFWKAQQAVLPELAGIARIRRASTSAGIFRTDTNVKLPGSNGMHVYLGIRDGADSVRFLKTLHERCWLAGLGWMMVGAGGQLLERSIVDRMVGAPERLVFEGAPILIEPLAQDSVARRPEWRDGDLLDTLAACPPLSIVEKAELDRLRGKAKHALAGEAAQARETYIKEKSKDLVARTGMSPRAARETVERQCNGVLTPSVVLPFDDPELAGKTVADVLADPAAFDGETLADPLEGVEYGPTKAMVMRRADGSVWIHSFAHGRTTYELKLDAAAIRAAMEKAAQDEAVATLVDMLLKAEVSATEEESLVAAAHQRTGIGIRPITRQIKQARQARAKEEAKQARERKAAERDDPRPVLGAPPDDAPYKPQMDAYNDVLRRVKDRIPPARNVEGDLAYMRRIEMVGSHAFVGANESADTTGKPPPQYVISVMSEAKAAEMLERHIDFVDGKGESVHCPSLFVRHYMQRDDGVLPPLVAVATLPIVGARGHMIHADGLDRDRGIVFEVEPELMKVIPPRQACDERAVGDAMRLLLDEWLADVAADHAGKCSLVALAATIIERSLIDDRPTWFVTAGQRGSGKTTALNMIIRAVTGTPGAASAWSPNEEERRKALLSYLMTGVPYILWDNINRGTQISCGHIEKACTSAFYADRLLGKSEMVRTAVASVFCFTGNNVAPKGDLASRSLQVRLDVDRIDPENRDFRHPDPVGWTIAHRNEILTALFTILLGNPALDLPRDATFRTRFKMWHRLVGSAVEHAVKCMGGETLDFGSLFLVQEADEEDAADLGETLQALDKMMKGRNASVGRGSGWFSAGDCAGYITSHPEDENAQIVRSFLFATLPTGAPVSAKQLSKRLRAYRNQTVKCAGRTLVLRGVEDKTDKTLKFEIATKE